MKKIVFTLIILTGVLQVKAQQLSRLTDSLWGKKFQLKTDSFTPPKLGNNFRNNQNIKMLPFNSGLLANVDNMPVVKLPVNSKMPIVQTDITGYTMPVAGKKVSGVYYMKKPGVITPPESRP
jgi:hypothetical protein